jgi:hypothetical protein
MIAFVLAVRHGAASVVWLLESVGVADMAKQGLYANIHAKRERIKQGSKERMRKPGTRGAPTAQAWKQAAKTVKKNKGT